MKKLLSKKLCRLSRDLISQKHQFSNQIYSDAVASHIYLNYLKYKDDPEIPNKNKLLEHFLNESEYLINGMLFGKKVPYSRTHKELLEIENHFIDWYSTKEKKEMIDPNFVIDIRKLHRINFNNEIVDETSVIKPSFYFQKKKSKKYLAVFATEIGETDKQFFVSFSGGLKRAFFSVGIGLDDPEFFMDIGCLLSRAQSMFDYWSASELRQGVKEAFAFIDIIYPTIAAFVEESCAIQKVTPGKNEA